MNISLEEHLVKVLDPLRLLLPSSLASQLTTYLPPNNAVTIPYSLLISISQWVRTQPQGKFPLDRNDYTMIALLAGSKTDPDRFFPDVVSREDAEKEKRERQISDRKAVTALVNALLSIGGSGIAFYWASGRLSWKNEFRVLFSLFAAIIVAASEAALYILWQKKKRGKRAARKRLLRVQDKRDVGEEIENPVSVAVEGTSVEVHKTEGLRQRAVGQ